MWLKPYKLYRQEKPKQDYIRQSKQLDPVHNSAIKTSFFWIFCKLSCPGKFHVGISERPRTVGRSSSLNPTHQAINKAEKHCTVSFSLFKNLKRWSAGLSHPITLMRWRDRETITCGYAQNIPIVSNTNTKQYSKTVMKTVISWND